ncbi:mismatch-specific DNA-glycosylase [Rhodococcus rhodnii]|uniref:Mismatch-specific DNA-glycosylase n=2 Tax=Rhodococcus rhodnii TaxID=38312 RepID=A0A6P2CJ65_9NOCA|nr:mismatch-specific DNA-glycosylase [Rhodococcus rhodnii]EOM76152.1 putative DNA glycosylase [Rhodococcus rhodnii LMG 5362]TXG91801.1 mismatch-specific DNA-glycosylase [Rhodococcus rhodnii]
MGFTRAELEAYRDAEIHDLVGPRCRLLFVGINPGLWTAAVGAHFARPGNRFYPALAAAGIVDRPIDASRGMSDDDARALTERGIGITNLVRRATARADELTKDELRAGRAELHETVRRISPSVVAILGITAYRTAFGVRDAVLGRAAEPFENAALWLLPNPSGLNAHETVASLGHWYRAAAADAGIVDTTTIG